MSPRKRNMSLREKIDRLKCRKELELDIKEIIELCFDILQGRCSEKNKSHAALVLFGIVDKELAQRVEAFLNENTVKLPERVFIILRSSLLRMNGF